MDLTNQLKERSGGKCELCDVSSDLNIYTIPPANLPSVDESIFICHTCQSQLDKQEQLDATHWKVLSTTMWSEHIPVQVVAWRMLNRLRHESWATDCLDILYLDEPTLAWARLTGDHELDSTIAFHLDSNGTRLYDGDTVVLIKTLDVKGSSLNAKLGTVVKNIKLVSNNTDQIEGKIEGQTIVILTKYLRKG